MALVTLFSAPKAFVDPQSAVAQRNAVHSWKHLDEVDVLLLGDEIGLAEAAREAHARHIPQVAKNANHVPLISSMLKQARDASDSPLLGIVNTDIILMQDFTLALRTISELQAAGRLNKHFVLVSQRWDLDVTEPIGFETGWDGRLRADVDESGRLHRPTGSDVFVFPRECYSDVPDFAIGRAGWDNWMIYRARQHGWPVIDLTPSVMIVHQNHGYGHLPGAKPPYDHPDTAVNTQLAGGQAATRYSILDATHELRDGQLIRPRLSGPRLARGFELALRRLFFFLPENALESIARPKRWKKRLRGMFRRTRA